MIIREVSVRGSYPIKLMNLHDFNDRRCQDGEDLDTVENSKEKNVIDEQEIKDRKVTMGEKDDKNCEDDEDYGDDEEEENEDEDDEDEDDEDEDEDDEPPLLKFSRITKLPKTFKRDAISTCLFHEKIFAFGTHAGVLHLTSTDFTPMHTLKCHRSSILSINTNGSFFATASIDGTVAIGQIEDTRNITLFDFKRPVQAVVLDADYKNSKTFVSGGMAGEVILSQRNWLGSRVDIILSKGHGHILGVYRIDDVIFWMNDAGITFYSISARAQLLNVPFPTEHGNNTQRPDLYRPEVHCPETDRIIVGWASHVWMFKVSLKQAGESANNNFGAIISSAASSLRAQPDKKVELEHYFTVNMLIAGISSFKDDQLMCLGFENDNAEQGMPISNIPQISIIDILTGEETHSDEIVVKNYERNSLNEYHLGKHIGDSSPEYFLVAPNDAISIQELSFKDHYDWFMKRGNFLRAWEIGKYVVDNYERLGTGLKFIDQLISSNQRIKDSALSLAMIIADTNVSENDDFKSFALEKWVKEFMRIIDLGEIDAVAKNVPLHPQLDKQVYDSILEHFLEACNLQKFTKYIEIWPLSYFSVTKFESELEERIETHDDNESAYRDAVIYLYLEEQRFSKAIPHMLIRRDVRVLRVLLHHNFLAQYKHNLLDIVLLPYHGKIEDLPKLSVGEAEKLFSLPLQLLVQNRQSLQVQQVMELLSSPKELKILLFLYLKKLSFIDPLLTAPFETDMVELYSKFERPELLLFLKTKTNYDVEKAIETCFQNDGSYNELIYLWSKIGETKKALSLIIDELNDPKLAIDFVKNLDDPELYDFMVNYSMDKPKFVKALLASPDEFGRTYLEVIKGMPETMEIEGLRKTLIRITKENALSLTVSKSLFKIIDDETTMYAMELLKLRGQGKLFHSENEDSIE